MAGRGGRGGKSTSSFTNEQLQALGCSGKDMPGVTLAPPPLFPTLIAKPVPLELNPDREFKILWKEDFISFLKDSPYYLHRKSEDTKSLQRYCDAIVNVLENDPKSIIKSEFQWDTLPSELRPNYKRAKKDASKVNSKKLKPSETVTEKLKILEEKEKREGDKEVKVEKTDDNEDEEKDDEELEEMEDEEMDDDNDYGNNYFDNGEAFNEEDDNLDDGPVY